MRLVPVPGGECQRPLSWEPNFDWRPKYFQVDNCRPGEAARTKSKTVSKQQLGKVVKAHADGEDFWYVIFPGERAEEFDNEKEANDYLADMRKLEARKHQS